MTIYKSTKLGLWAAGAALVFNMFASPDNIVSEAQATPVTETVQTTAATTNPYGIEKHCDSMRPSRETRSRDADRSVERKSRAEIYAEEQAACLAAKFGNNDQEAYANPDVHNGNTTEQTAMANPAAKQVISANSLTP